MTNKTMAAVGFTAIFAGSSFIVLPAQAAIDCGTEPSGATITNIGDICQLAVTGGDDPYNFTVPESATELFALVVGGGGGNIFNSFEGYAGNAGQVRYFDMSDSVGTELTMIVGSAGANNDVGEIAGEASSVTSVSSGQSITAAGGASNFDAGESFCTQDSWSSTATFAGTGARALKVSENNDDKCANGVNRGVNPANGDRDSDNVAAPSIFSTLSTTFGTGGRIVDQSLSLPTLNPGDGAGFKVNVDAGPFTDRQYAADGAIYLRWRTGSSLANTGSSSFENTIFATAFLGAGLTLIALANRRKKSRGAHKAQ